MVELCHVIVTRAGSRPTRFLVTSVSRGSADPLVRANNVALPDEYDQIERDLLPFRALSPEEISRRQEALSGLDPTYTLQVTNRSLHTLLSIEEDALSGSGFKDRIDDQIKLIEPIVKYLEDFKAVYWLHDNPTTVITHDHKQDLLMTLRGRQRE